MFLFILSAIVLLAIRAKSIGQVPLEYNFFGREFSLFAALAILLLFAGVVLFWTSLPLITSTLSANPRAAEGATYNGFALVFSILLLLFLTFLPFLSRDPFQPPRWRSRLLWSIGIAIVGGVGLLFIDAEHPVKLIEVPVTEEMKGGFSLRWFGVKDLDVYHGQTAVSVPFREKKLLLSLDPFSKELKPGEEVEWGINVKN